MSTITIGSRPLNPWINSTGQVAHPNSPVGSGGCGMFRAAGCLGVGGNDSVLAPHPASPAARYLMQPEIQKALLASIGPDVMPPEEEPTPRVAVTVKPIDNYVRPVKHSDFIKEWNSPQSLGEPTDPGKPPWGVNFIQLSISAIKADIVSAADTATNMIIDSDKHGFWVKSLALEWVVTTTGFFDVSVIPDNAQSHVEAHEKMHRDIAQKTVKEFAAKLQDELEKKLPSKQAPHKWKDGFNSANAGMAVNYLLRQVDGIKDRYVKDEKAEEDKRQNKWDKDDAVQLKRIVESLLKPKPAHAPGSTIPDVPPP